MNSSNSFPWLFILGIIFIALKVTGYIAWSWAWVLLPIYAPILISVLLLIAVAVVWLAAASSRR